MNIEKIGVYGGIDASRVSHAHPYYEFRYIAAGACHFQTGRHRHLLTTGDFSFAFPLEKHCMVYDDGHPVTQYIFSCTLAEEDAPIRDHLRSLCTSARKIPVGERRYFFEMLRKKVSSGKKNLILSGVYQFLSFLYDRGAVVHTDSVENLHVEKALGIMQKALTSTLSLTDISRELEIDHSYFIRLFKKHLGQTPMKYVTRLRVDTAAAALAETDLPIQEIARKLQFQDQFHFSRVFKQVMGVAPRDYRNRKKTGL